MDLGEGVSAPDLDRLGVGLGLRSDAGADQLVTLVGGRLARLSRKLAGLPTILATIAGSDGPALRETAARLDLPLVVLTEASLLDEEERVPIDTRPPRVCLDLASAAEKAALAAAGVGSRLVVPLVNTPSAACTIGLLKKPSPETT